MTAEPLSQGVWSADPSKQKSAGYTIEDVLNLPDDSPRVELSDGVPTEIRLPIADITP
jgi:hypothetical protein